MNDADTACFSGSQIAGIWPLSPVKAPPPKPAESAQLLEMTFSENEDEDDDYHPSEVDNPSKIDLFPICLIGL